jgi:hypothetical protein
MPKFVSKNVSNREAQDEGVSAFIARSANGTIFHDPMFLGYHSDEKRESQSAEFRHLAFIRNDSVIAFLPGAIVLDKGDKRFVSTWGSSMGGLVILPAAEYSDIERMVDASRGHARDLGATEIRLTLTPACFQNAPGQDAVEFILRRHGFVPGEITLMLGCAVGDTDAFPTSVLDADVNRRCRSADARGVSTVVSPQDGLERFWPVLMETMKEHDATPTHSREELQRLLECWPDRFSIHLAMHEGVVIAGMLLIDVTATTATTFYICSRKDARALSPVAVLGRDVLRWAKARGLAWLDYGPSSFGAEPHTSLIRFKEQLGGRATLRRTYTATAL